MTQLKKGALELCVLALLEKGDRYGYELVTLISAEIEVTVGTIYPLLKRIKEDGCVETNTVESSDGPARKYYHLTDTGRSVLARQVAEWRSFSAKINRMIGAEEV
ncbi:MAG: PadR family transcriptional regulator [Oscillospiraceae bacterium]|jgi:PadR family transcriptional regulator PadR|nr:PadR family transcriptional regulator [Oscillospiraceae bacterium]